MARTEDRPGPPAGEPERADEEQARTPDELDALAEAGAEGIRYVVDSDAHKQGRLTPVTHLPVVAPERLRSEPVDVLILTALAYRDEIVAQLRGPIGFRGTIAVLGAPLELVDP